MSENYKFFQNKDCEYKFCHNIPKYKESEFSCLTCFCPLYTYDDCGGNYYILPNNIKSCEKCTLPHFNYDYVINKLIELQIK